MTMGRPAVCTAGRFAVRKIHLRFVDSAPAPRYNHGERTHCPRAAIAKEEWKYDYRYPRHDAGTE